MIVLSKDNGKRLAKKANTITEPQYKKYRHDSFTRYHNL